MFSLRQTEVENILKSKMNYFLYSGTEVVYSIFADIYIFILSWIQHSSKKRIGLS